MTYQDQDHRDIYANILISKKEVKKNLSTDVKEAQLVSGYLREGAGDVNNWIPWMSENAFIFPSCLIDIQSLYAFK